MRKTAVFVSYRRDDTGPFALALRSELDLRLQGVPVFVDLNRIVGGDAWPGVLRDALDAAKVVVALIGDRWDGGVVGGGLTRLAEDVDWVRREVAIGLQRIIVVPVLVNGASTPAALPDDIRSILDIQALPLRTEAWEADLGRICATLKSKFGIELKQTTQMLPTPDSGKREVASLGDEELQALRERGKLEGWTLEVVHDTLGTGTLREFLSKRFLFQSDKHAFEFIRKAGELALGRDHHPIIEAKYADVAVRLSTWDAGHRVTQYDTDMAEALNKLARRWRLRSGHG